MTIQRLDDNSRAVASNKTELSNIQKYELSGTKRQIWDVSTVNICQLDISNCCHVLQRNKQNLEKVSFRVILSEISCKMLGMLDPHKVHVLTLANSIIGVSLLAMPYCFKKVRIQ